MIPFRMGESKSLDFEITYTIPDKMFTIDAISSKYALVPSDTKHEDIPSTAWVPLTIDDGEEQVPATKHIVSTNNITAESPDIVPGTYFLFLKYKIGSTTKIAKYQIGVVE